MVRARRAYTEAKWDNRAPVSRRSVAEVLVTVTIALMMKEPGAPEPKALRQALFAWAFNPATLKHRAAHETRTIPIPPELVRLLRAHIIGPRRFMTLRIFRPSPAAKCIADEG